MAFRENIHKFQNRLFDTIMYITYFLYIVVAFGLSSQAPQYLNDLLYFTKVYVSLFLVYRFNPFRDVQFTELDRKIAFSAGTFLLATIAIDKILKIYLPKFSNTLTPFTPFMNITQLIFDV
jgi:hypothetical protein